MEKNIWPTNILIREKQSLLSSSQSSSLITEMFQNKKKLNDNNYSDNIEYIISEGNMININYRVFSYMVGSQKQYVLVFIDRAKIYSHIEPILIILGRDVTFEGPIGRFLFSQNKNFDCYENTYFDDPEYIKGMNSINKVG